MSQIKNTMKSKISKRRLAKKINQEEMKIKQQSKCRKNFYQREIDLPLLAQDSYNEFEDKK